MNTTKTNLEAKYLSLTQKLAALNNLKYLGMQLVDKELWIECTSVSSAQAWLPIVKQFCKSAEIETEEEQGNNYYFLILSI